MVAPGTSTPEFPWSERNANQRPSGDQRGVLAFLRLGINGCGGSFPSVDTIQMFVVRGTLGSLGSEGSLTLKATCLPSGEIWSSLSSRIERTSSGVMRCISRPVLRGLDATGFCASTVPTKRNVANSVEIRSVLVMIQMSPSLIQLLM